MSEYSLALTIIGSRDGDTPPIKGGAACMID